uniref:NF-kappa-B essential modulator-like isoform X2 n=1 Tax=Myxine glutinosa TaxID=7769 RepID=UPI00358E00EB
MEELTSSHEVTNGPINGIANATCLPLSENEARVNMLELDRITQEGEGDGEDVAECKGEGASGMAKPSPLASAPSSLKTPEENLQQLKELLRENHELKVTFRGMTSAMQQHNETNLLWLQRQKQEREFVSIKMTEAQDAMAQLLAERDCYKQQLEEVLTQLASIRQIKQPEELQLYSCCCQPIQASQDYTAPTSSQGCGFIGLRDQEEIHPQSQSQGCYGEPVGSEYLVLLKKQKKHLEQELQSAQEHIQRLTREKEDLVTMNSALQMRLKPSKSVKAGSDPSSYMGINAEEEMNNGRVKPGVEDNRENELHLELEQTPNEVQCSQATKAEEASRLLESCKNECKVLHGQLHQARQSRQDLARQLETMQSQTEKQYPEDVATLKAQVRSLVEELGEVQDKLRAAVLTITTQRESYEEKMSQVQELERKLDGQHEQYTRDVNRLSLQAHNMEGALKRERLKASEEKRKQVHLQTVYNELFGNYNDLVKEMDVMKGTRSEGQESLREQLQECEEALVVKQEHIDKMKNKISNQQTELESIPVLKAQAEIFKADFLTERQQREQIHSEKERVKEQLEAMRQENERLKNELDKMGRNQIAAMQRRHNTDLFTTPDDQMLPQPLNELNAPPGSTAASVLTQPMGALECPICHFSAPDIDTLQIHVQDCIQ